MLCVHRCCYAEFSYKTMKTMQRRTLAVVLVLILNVSTRVQALTTTSIEKHGCRLINGVVVVVENDEGNVVDAAKWRTNAVINGEMIPRQNRDRTKSTRRSWTETEQMSKCRQNKPCPDPTESGDWIQDRCEAIFATVGTIWSYCSCTGNTLLNIPTIPLLYHIHQIITFLSVKIQNTVRSIFANNINCISDVRLGILVGLY